MTISKHIRTYKVKALDGYQLEVSYFEPKESNGQSILLLPATGVLRRFYNDFLCYLASQGFNAYNFDYRGIGGSRNGPLKGFEASANDWALKDASALIAHVKAEHSNDKIIIAGHSIGGQFMGLLANDPAIDKVLFVAAQSGYWKHWDGVGRLKMFLHTHILLPAITKSMGYFPAKRLGLFEDLPKGAAIEWAKWCRSKNYLYDHYPEAYERSESTHKPILMYSFEDDAYAPRRSVEWFKQRFVNASITHYHVRPEEIGVKSIGHFNFFKKHLSEHFWPGTSKWLVDN